MWWVALLRSETGENWIFINTCFHDFTFAIFLSCFSIDFTGQEFVMKATRVQYCQMSVICPSNFWCVWQCDMMSDKNTCSPALKNRQINRWKTQLFFTDSIQPIDAVVLSSAAAACESSLGNKVLQVLKFFFQGMWIF